VAERYEMLLVDDDPALRQTVREAFERDGHRVVAVPDGEAAVARAGAERFDVVLLDVALGPGLDGNEVARTLRSRRNLVPIIMLTARDSEADAVLGLEAGADDYVTKPFGLAELRSRIRAVRRRADPAGQEEDILRVGPLELDRRRREVRVAGRPAELTFVEWELLERLMTVAGLVRSREELLEAIWGDSAYRDPRGIDVHVRHLREKLEAHPEHPELILTVRGAGYRLRGP